MKQLSLPPQIHRYANCKAFAEDFGIGKGDLVLTNAFLYEPYFGDMSLGAEVLYQERYGSGEPDDEMAEAILRDRKEPSRRVIAIGGGTVLDLAKLLALRQASPVADLFDRKLPLVKDKELVLVPTTCGTGSEVTNISILEMKSRRTKLGLADSALYADSAVLIPQLLEGLPYRFFAASSIDALVHAAESGVSPKATPYTKLFGYKAIEMILGGYQKIAEGGESARIPLLEDFLIAGNYAGIAFGNAGVGAVHAMSYPLGGKYHIPHGEANYALFVRVFEHYLSIRDTGAVAELGAHMAPLLGCEQKEVFPALEALLGKILPRKPLREYGVTEEDIPAFTQNVVETQTRLTANSFVPFDAARVAQIYRELL